MAFLDDIPIWPDSEQGCLDHMRLALETFANHGFLVNLIYEYHFRGLISPRASSPERIVNTISGTLSLPERHLQKELKMAKKFLGRKSSSGYFGSLQKLLGTLIFSIVFQLIWASTWVTRVRLLTDASSAEFHLLRQVLLTLT